MKKYLKVFSLFCSLLLVFFAFPVLAQKQAANEVEINKKPFQDFADLVIDKLQKKDIALSESFLIEINGELAADGKFDRQKTRFIRADGGEQMVNIAKSLIEAVSESGYLGYFRQLGIGKFNLIYAQNDQQVYAIMRSGGIPAEKAKTIATFLNAAINIAKHKPNNDDEKVLLNGTNVSAQEDLLILKVVLEKSVAQEMIQRNLAEEINRRLAEEKNR